MSFVRISATNHQLKTNGLHNRVKIVLKIIKKLGKDFEDTLFPEYRCFVCGREVFDTEIKLCETCKKKFPFITGNICQRCGMPIPDGNHVCDACKNVKYNFDASRASFCYNAMTHGILYQLKYGGKKFIAKYFGELVYKTYTDWGIVADVVIPVPLHRIRQKKRGYNQSELIADRFSELSGVPINIDIIYRTKETPNQTRLKKSERERNLLGVFEINKSKKLKGKTLLIIDDIFTTGSTANEISKMLLKFKPSAIYVITPGKTIYNSNNK